MSKGNQRRTTAQLVVPFGTREFTAYALGGKGMSLAALAQSSFPVPPGFTITTSAARAYMHEGRFPKRLLQQIETIGLPHVERASSLRFGDQERPLLVSVRSGAMISMPGMMETIPNVGLHPSTMGGCMSRLGMDTALDCFARLSRSLAETLNPFLGMQLLSKDSSPKDQLYAALGAVAKSWFAPRAIAYRKHNNIADDLGTAITVQQMVFGNAGDDSCTGVALSHDPHTGLEILCGDFLVNAQGHDLVGGVRTPRPILELDAWNASVHAELKEHVARLALLTGFPVEVEFTVEHGQLFLLQHRRAVLTPEAKVVYAVHAHWARSITRDAATRILTEQEVERLTELKGFEPSALATATSLALGASASAGVAIGQVAHSASEATRLQERGIPVVLVRPMTTPDDYSAMIAAQAIVTQEGGSSCHAAIVARAKGIPAVVGVGNTSTLRSGMWVSVDGTHGVIYEGQHPLVATTNTKEVNLWTRWYKAGQWSEPRVDAFWTKQLLSANDLLRDFYLAERVAVETKGSVLSAQAQELHRLTAISVAEIFATYLTLAVASELRHAEPQGVLGVSAELQQLKSEYDIGVYAHSASQVLRYQTSREKTQNFFRLAERVFAAIGWEYLCGGPKWAAIARCGAEFFEGKLSHVLFVDQVFDLRHNGNTLFDKHEMLSSYTCESLLHRQLDHKRYATSFCELVARLGMVQEGPHHHPHREKLHELFSRLELSPTHG